MIYTTTDCSPPFYQFCSAHQTDGENEGFSRGESRLLAPSVNIRCFRRVELRFVRSRHPASTLVIASIEMPALSGGQMSWTGGRCSFVEVAREETHSRVLRTATTHLVSRFGEPRGEHREHFDVHDAGCRRKQSSPCSRRPESGGPNRRPAAHGIGHECAHRCARACLD